VPVIFLLHNITGFFYTGPVRHLCHYYDVSFTQPSLCFSPAGNFHYHQLFHSDSLSNYMRVYTDTVQASDTKDKFKVPIIRVNFEDNQQYINYIDEKLDHVFSPFFCTQSINMQQIKRVILKFLTKL